MFQYHEDAINVFVINCRLKWKGDKKEYSTYSMKIFAYAETILVAMAVPLVCK